MKVAETNGAILQSGFSVALSEQHFFQEGYLIMGYFDIFDNGLLNKYQKNL
jgi:hypothetical protein